MDLYRKVLRLYENYRGKKCVVGKSAEGRGIFAFFIGQEGGRIGLSQSAMHAREWITAELALLHIDRGVSGGGVWVLPLINPDGALLCTEGIGSVCDPRRREMLLRVNGGEDFSLWKANADCVDLNVNFDARWGKGARNLICPAPAGYIGSHPFCAPESAALKNFTYLVRPDYTVSWHTKGEEIYWRFHQPIVRMLRDYFSARRLSKSTGYPLCDAPRSAGGYKDWCIDRLKIPAFTVEVGSDSLSHPIGAEALPAIVQSNLGALEALSRKDGYGRKIHACRDR